MRGRQSIYFSHFVTNKFDLKGMQMFPITFENVQKMFEKCSNFRNACFQAHKITLNDFKKDQFPILIGPEAVL